MSTREEFRQRIEDAKARLPMREFMRRHGLGPKGDNWGTMECPVCRKAHAGIFKAKHGRRDELFKCFHSGCSTGGKALDQIGLLSATSSMTTWEAAVALMKETGAWKGRNCGPSVLTGRNQTKEKEPDMKNMITVRAEKADGETPGTGAGSSGGSISDQNPGEIAITGDAGKDGAPRVGALQWFLDHTSLSDEDAEKLWEKRGLLRQTCRLAGLRSSLKSNQDLLRGMLARKLEDGTDEVGPGKYSLEELKEWDLWVNEKRFVLADGHREISDGDGTGAEGTEGTAGKQGGGISGTGAGGFVPNKLLFGFGIFGKTRGRDGKKRIEWGWPHPVLIPYFDERGDVVAIRPHKGGNEGSAPRLYVVRPCRELKKEWLSGEAVSKLVITEGEFKALAVWQGLGGSAAVSALPGVTMARVLEGEVEDWISAVAPEGNVVIAYDNEEKGDEKLPGFVKDPAKRFDADIWAWFLCKVLKDKSFHPRVAALPDEWRDEKGKSDWDGALVFLRTATVGKEGSTGANEGAQLAIWGKCARKIRAAFAAVLNGAAEFSKMMDGDLFNSFKKRTVKNRLRWLLYDRKLPVGSEKEAAMAYRFRRFYNKHRGDAPQAMGGLLLMLADTYLKVSGSADADGRRAHGCYYTLKPWSDKYQAKWEGMLAKAKEESDAEARRVAEEALLGSPKEVADFHCECRHVLKTNVGGQQDRLEVLTVHSKRGKSFEGLEMPSAASATTTDWRRWLRRAGPFTWHGGQTELDDMMEDLAEQSWLMELTMVYIRGYNSEAKAWICKDAAYPVDPRDGESEILPGRDGVFQINGTGYKLSQRDAEGQQFVQGEPMMHPHQPDPPMGIARLWDEFCFRLHETLGGYDGWSLAAVTLARACATVIIERFGGFPITWIHGPAQSGKTTLAKISQNCWGSNLDPAGAEKSGITVAQDARSSMSTKAGLQIAFAQYGDLPVYCEEVQPHMEGWLVELFKSAHGRERSVKQTYGENDRKVTATALVTGIATTSNVQLKTRTLFIPVSADKRRGDHLPWFRANAKCFYSLGRFVMRNLGAYQKTFMAELDKWVNDPAKAKFDSRNRLVFGVCYASMAAIASLLRENGRLAATLPPPSGGAQTDPPCEPRAKPSVLQPSGAHAGKELPEGWFSCLSEEALGDYEMYLTRQMQVTGSELKEDLDLHRFWKDLMSAMTEGDFGRNAREMGIFFLVESKEVMAPKQDIGQIIDGKKWERVILYFDPEKVIEVMKEFKRRKGETFRWGRSDLLAQLKLQNYWVASKRGDHRKYFPSRGGNATAWAVDLDFHEMGWLHFPTDEVIATVEEAAKAEALVEGREPGAWECLTPEFFRMHDPRRGELYQLAAAVTRKAHQGG
jgi:hypothetical protein